MDNYNPDSGTDDARSEGGDASDARREEAARIASEGINENGGYPKSSDEIAVERRAYALWEDEGRPDGKHDEHWARALEELKIGAA